VRIAAVKQFCFSPDLSRFRRDFILMFCWDSRHLAIHVVPATVSTYHSKRCATFVALFKFLLSNLSWLVGADTPGVFFGSLG